MLEIVLVVILAILIVVTEDETVACLALIEQQEAFRGERLTFSDFVFEGLQLKCPTGTWERYAKVPGAQRGRSSDRKRVYPIECRVELLGHRRLSHLRRRWQRRTAAITRGGAQADTLRSRINGLRQRVEVEG